MALEHIRQDILKRASAEGDHLIITSDDRRDQSRLMRLRIDGVTHSIIEWLYICTYNPDPLTKILLKKACDNDKCINIEHWANILTFEGSCNLAKYNLWKGSIQSGDCRLWTGYITSDGYGRTHFRAKSRYTHVISYIIHNQTEDIPEGQLVRHKCQNRNCIAPEHLELGTAKDNSSDQLRDGTAQIGSKNSRATIDEKIALEIYQLRSTVTIQDRADKFGVSRGIVECIDDGLNWSHVTGHKKPEVKVKVKNLIIDDKTPESVFINAQERVKKNSKIVFDSTKKEFHWIWKLCKNHAGYGQTNLCSTIMGAHMLSWIVFNRKPIPKGYIICHSCAGHPDCVNPSHLYLGTHKTNTQDKIKDGMMSQPGITKDIAEAIMKSKGNGTSAERAELYKVSSAIVHHIDKGRTWKQLREELHIPITDSSKNIKAELAEQIMRSEGNGTIKERADQFKVSHHTIRDIDSGSTWKVLRKNLNIP
jgi:hypothetical protein